MDAALVEELLQAPLVSLPVPNRSFKGPMVLSCEQATSLAHGASTGPATCGTRNTQRALVRMLKLRVLLFMMYN